LALGDVSGPARRCVVELGLDNGLGLGDAKCPTKRSGTRQRQAMCVMRQAISGLELDRVEDSTQL